MKMEQKKEDGMEEERRWRERRKKIKAKKKVKGQKGERRWGKKKEDGGKEKSR